jgi:beta-ureidopropionase / N-carbamoyl-L-amino-acid hydrolase
LTVAMIETRPSSANTVPGFLRFFIDLRHPDGGQYRALRTQVEGIVETALARHRLGGGISCVWEAAGVVFDTGCVTAVRQAAAALGYDALEMVSGAGHDSVNVSCVVPTSMIFVPCAGGLSHNEAESASQGDLEKGANVLMHALLAVAKVGD